MTGGLIGFVVRRAWADRRVIAAAWALLAVALGVLAAGSLYTASVTRAGLIAALERAPVADRSIVVRTTLVPDRLPAADTAVRTAVDVAFSTTGATTRRLGTSGSFATTDDPGAPIVDLTVLAAIDAPEEVATLVDGAWAGDASPDGFVEATLSEGAAAALGLAIGDEVELVDRVRDAHRIRVRLVGIWQPDRSDPFWLDDPLLLDGVTSGGEFTTRGPWLVPWARMADGTIAGTVNVQWRVSPSLDRFRVEVIDEIDAAVTALPARINAALPASNEATVSTRLPTVLRDVDRAALVTASGIQLLLVQFAALAGYAIVLVAALVLERRAGEAALIAARGAGSGQRVLLVAMEAAVIVVLAALTAPILGVGLAWFVGSQPGLDRLSLPAPAPGADTLLVVGVGAIVALGALVLPAIAAGVGGHWRRGRAARPQRRTLGQRVSLDLVLLGLGAVALWQLRAYGGVLTVQARGALGADPLLVAAPAIGLLGGALVSIRLLPTAAELAERLLARPRGLLAPLISRQLSRRPLRYTRAALLLVLASALGTFATAYGATWTRSQLDQAAHAAAADLRIGPGTSDIPPALLGPRLRDVDGVAAASPVGRLSVDIGQVVRGGTVLAVDPAGFGAVVTLRAEDQAPSVHRALDALAAATSSAMAEIASIDVPRGTRRVAVEIEHDVGPDPEFAPLPTDVRPLSAGVLVLDGDGRIWALAGEPAALAGTDRLVIRFADPADPRISVPEPVRILGVELAVASSAGSLLEGAITLEGLAASPSDGADDWTALALPSSASDWHWERDRSGTPEPYGASIGAGARLGVDGVFGGQRVLFRLESLPTEGIEIPAIASERFVAATGVGIGEVQPATIFGRRAPLRIVGIVETVPSVSADDPFVVVAGTTLGALEAASAGRPSTPHEWWLRLGDGAAVGDGAVVGDDAAVGERLERPPVNVTILAERTAVERELRADPLALGVIGVLGLGTLAALAFSSIGFLVSTSVSATERLSEFALLRALGLTPRQLRLWLVIESVLLLAVGLSVGAGLGALLAWLVLPQATLTATGAPPTPIPLVVLDAGSLLPTLVAGLVLVPVTLVLLRGQLAAARMSSVLRARDE